MHRFPHFAGSRYTLLAAGWDCVAVDVDDHWVFKFPRHGAAEERLRVEIGLLEVLHPRLTMSVPAPTLVQEQLAFSRHLKLKGDHLVAKHSRMLFEGAWRRVWRFSIRNFMVSIAGS